MSTDKGYATVSIPRGIADAIDELIEELGYWPSRGAFVREATLQKIKEEQRRLLEIREFREATEENPIQSGEPASDEEESHSGGNRSVPRG